MGVVEREMTVVERVVSLLGPSDMAESESTARTLTAITRALHEIKAINQPDEMTSRRVTATICFTLNVI